MSTTDIDLKGKTALVTGASSGIGDSLARLLASRGADLILVARRLDRLEALGKELSDKHKVKVQAISQDLSVPNAAAELFAKTEGQGRRVELLMNNAGFGTQDFFLDIPWERTAQEIQLNITALTELAYRFGRAMRERKQGWILNVASIAAYVPTSQMATYSAGKAYVRHFSQALAHELQPHGVHVTCVNPGGTVTEFHEKANQYIGPAFGVTFISADKCAEVALDALFGGRTNVVPGISTKLMSMMLSITPRALAIPITAAITGKRDLAPGEKKA